MKHHKRLLAMTSDEKGTSAVEYAVLIALIIAVLIVIIGILGEDVQQLFSLGPPFGG